MLVRVSNVVYIFVSLALGLCTLVDSSCTVSCVTTDVFDIRKVNTMVFFPQLRTTGNNPIWQLACSGGSAYTLAPTVRRVACTNVRVAKGASRWKCLVKSNHHVHLGTTKIACESNSTSTLTPFKIKGSCALEYTLEYDSVRHNAQGKHTNIQTTTDIAEAEAEAKASNIEKKAHIFAQSLAFVGVLLCLLYVGCALEPGILRAENEKLRPFRTTAFIIPQNTGPAFGTRGQRAHTNNNTR
jgi:hypothetical protein